VLDGKQAVFLSCMTAYGDRLVKPIRDQLNAAGYRAVVAMYERNPLGTSNPEEKVNGLMEASDAFVALATIDNRLIPEWVRWILRIRARSTAQNIIDEIARARVRPNLRDKVLVMKQASVTLPSNINPVYEPLDPDNPDAAFEIIREQLEAWGVVSAQSPPTPSVVTDLTEDYLEDLLDGIDLGERDATEARLRRLFCRITKQDQHRVARDLFERLLTIPDDASDIHIAGGFLEACTRIDAALIEPGWIEQLVDSEAFQRRSSAAVILWERALVDPGDVPLDQIAKLAKPSKEDWYVYSPAIAALKELALTRRSALHVLLDLAESPEATDRFTAVSALSGIAGVDPAIVWGAAREQLGRLAHDPDEGVANPAFELLASLRQSDPDTRDVYGHFGM
jgi:hypothetical protein